MQLLGSDSIQIYQTRNGMLSEGILTLMICLSYPLILVLSSCHTLLSICWKAQQSDEYSHPSLIKTICRAYGWPYFRLGLLKVLNGCLGFAGPLLRNKLIRFL